MQTLLNDRKVGKITPWEFSRTLVESSYASLRQNANVDVFPPNCHKNAAVNSLSLEAQDYQYMLSGCADSSIKLWDLRQQEQASGSKVAGAGDDDLITPAAGSLDDYDIQHEDFDNPIKVYKALATVPRKSVHDFGVSCIQWWPVDSGMFILASFDHTLKVWDTNELNPVHNFDLNNRIYTFDVCHQNTLIATGSDQPFIRLLDLRSTSSAHTLGGHKVKTLSLKWHPKNPHLLASGGFDGEVKIWDIRRSKACLCRLDMLRTNSSVQASNNLTKTSVKAHLAPVNGMVWDQLGHSLFTAGNDDKVRVWDLIGSEYPPVNKLTSFGPLTRNKFHQTIPLTLNYKYESELQYLMFPSDSGDIFIFRAVDGKLITRLNRRGSKNIGRTCSIAQAAPFLNTFYCGTIDGEILAYSPHVNNVKVKDIVDSSYGNDNRSVMTKEMSSKAREFLDNPNSYLLDIDRLS